MGRATKPNKKERIRYYKHSYKHRQKAIGRKYIADLKLSKGCCICGYKEYAGSLDFHHIMKKHKSVSSMVESGYKVSTIQTEIDKCEIICANCHRKKHWTGTSLTKGHKKNQFIVQIKLKSACILCGESHISTLDFDHLDESKKVAGIGYMIRDKQYTIADLDAEVKKCQIICANCHRAKSHDYCKAANTKQNITYPK